jgi:hypothetical protein
MKDVWKGLAAGGSKGLRHSAHPGGVKDVTREQPSILP